MDNGDHDATQITGYGWQGHSDVEMFVQGTHGTIEITEPIRISYRAEEKPPLSVGCHVPCTYAC